MAPKRRGDGNQRQNTAPVTTPSRNVDRPANGTVAHAAPPNRGAPVKSGRSRLSFSSQPKSKLPIPAPAIAGIGVVVVLVLALVVLNVVNTGQVGLYNPFFSTAAEPVSNPNLPADNEKIYQEPNEGQTHVPEGSAIVYKNPIPSSGNHYPSPANWGIYTTPLAEGYWVHNLEHGGIDVLYNCPTGCSDLTNQLATAFKTFPKDKYNEVKMVITPWVRTPPTDQVVAVAWGWVDEMKVYDPAALRRFYDAHVDRGPEDIP